MSDWKEKGIERGRAVASWVDTPEIGESVPKDIDWIGVDTIETENDQAEAFEMMAHDAEENDREFSPFEETAKEINDLGEFESAEAWSDFDDGIHEGIMQEWQNRNA